MNSERKISAHPVVYVLVILAALNLAVSTALLFEGRATSSEKVKVITSLPGYLTGDEIEYLKNRVVRMYNDRDADKFYSALDEVAKVQISKASLVETLDKLYNMAGSIDDAAYINFSDLASQGQPGNYVLNFSVRVSGSGFSGGSMTITIFDRGDHYGMIGFFLNPKFMARAN